MFYQSNYISRTANLTYAHHYMDVDLLPQKVRNPPRFCYLHPIFQTNTRFLRYFSDGPALIILALVTANIRNCSLPSSKVRAMDVFLALACHLTDEAKLDRMVPYIVELLHDDSALVRSAALRTLMQAVSTFFFLNGIFITFLLTSFKSDFFLFFIINELTFSLR